MISLSSFW